MKILTPIDEIHLSEVSIIEAKAKIHRLNQSNPAYHRPHQEFGTNLRVLREDHKIYLHRYQQEADPRFNFPAESGTQLDAFDTVIIAQSARVGLLLTEDREILSLRETDILENPIMQGLRIQNWRETYKAT